MKLVLPFPPSVNNLFVNARGDERSRPISAKYRKWRKRATQAMWGQSLQFFEVPVALSMVFEDNGRSDLDNLQKAVIDHLVHHKLIVDDSRPWVREIHLCWGDVKGVEVEVRAA
jgi:Holliday junction resolvase RusA-like endonuclease